MILLCLETITASSSKTNKFLSLEIFKDRWNVDEHQRMTFMHPISESP
jgi:hypothetical protein